MSEQMRSHGSLTERVEHIEEEALDEKAAGRASALRSRLQEHLLRTEAGPRKPADSDGRTGGLFKR